VASDRDTAAYLAIALRAAGAPPDMITQAQQGYYHDYLSPLALPISQLVADATRYGLTEIAERAKRGDFDATKAEADAWAASPDGQAAFRDLIEGR
jgi:hypothetical protein